MSTRYRKDLNFLASFYIITIVWHGLFRKEISMVLIISSSKRRAQVINDIFYYMGIPSYAVTPTEALSEISGLYRAALVLEPQELADAESFIAKLRSYVSSIPIFAISDTRDFPAYIFDDCFSDSIYSSTLIEEIVKYQSERGLPLSAHYRLAGIDASCDRERITVFGETIAFTKTETMILRYLIASYPKPQDAKSIIRYAYRPTKKPELASIRTHISVMNRKFREATGKTLFLGIDKEGYVMSTPELVKAYADNT